MQGELPPVPGRRLLASLFDQHAIPPGANPGLVFDRFLRIWSAWDRGLPVVGKSEYLATDLADFTRAYRAQAQVGAPGLEEAHRRLAQVTPHARRHRFTSRFVTGLGAGHPLENGFSFDHAIGAPIIAGSGVKGLCRAVSCFDDADGAAEHAARLFGPDVDSENPFVGDLVFLPALPAEWPRLEVDVINAHHMHYGEGRLKDPVDIESPIPIFFLAVAAGTEFVFRLFSRSGDESAVRQGFEWLAAGLGTLGIGAKTAVGYGVVDET